MSAQTTELHEQDVIATADGVEVDDVTVVARREEPEDDFAARLGKAARENPLPAALIAVGAAWLFAGGSRVSIFGTRTDGASGVGGSAATVVPAGYALVPAGQVEGGYGPGGGYGDYGVGMGDAASAARRAGRSVSHVAGAASERVGRAGERLGEGASEAASELADGARGAASGVASTVSGAADAVSSTLSAGAETLEDGVEAGARGLSRYARSGAAAARTGVDRFGRTSAELAATTRSTAREAWDDTRFARENVREFFEERPLAIGLVSAAAGIGLAALLPRTRVEDDLIGERSDALKRRARDVVSDRAEAARRGADDVVAKLVRDAQARGLSQDAIAAAIEQFTAKLEKVGEAAAEQAEEEVEKAGAKAKPKGTGS